MGNLNMNRIEFVTDSYFETGHSHTVCQDYALDGIYKGVPYIVTADGCGSVEGSDVGARVLAHAFKGALAEVLDSLLLPAPGMTPHEVKEKLTQRTLDRCKGVLDILRLDNTTLDATLLAAFVCGGRCWVFTCGDGVVMIKRNNTVDVILTEYQANAPRYLSYSLDKARLAQYRRGAALNRVMIKKLRYQDGEWNLNGEASFYEGEEPRLMVMDTSELRFVSLASDGITSYRRKIGYGEDECAVGKEPDLAGMVDSFLGYKNHHGRFVQRRMKRLKSDFQKMGVIHDDDISSATIFFTNNVSHPSPIGTEASNIVSSPCRAVGGPGGAAPWRSPRRGPPGGNA